MGKREQFTISVAEPAERESPPAMQQQPRKKISVGARSNLSLFPRRPFVAAAAGAIPTYNVMLPIFIRAKKICEVEARALAIV